MDIQPITTMDAPTWARIVTGYTSTETYAVNVTETDAMTTFTLTLITLDTPYVKQFEPWDDGLAKEYQASLASGFSLGTYVDDVLVGLAIAAPVDWNNTLWLQEFHIAPSHRGQGIGRALMQALFDRSTRYRLVYLETQNTNIPAIRFYRRMGFAIESVDVSLYTNIDLEDGEVAIFMKRKMA